MNIEAPPRGVRCREIAEPDIDAVVALLARGFPGRPPSYWSRGLSCQGRRPLLPNVPRYGLMIESDGRPVGAILLLYADRMVEGETRLRCNLSSWYVDPAFRIHASMLILRAVKAKSVTYLNISPAPHTWPTIEAQGFRRYAAGLFVGLPALRPGVPGAKVRRVDPKRESAPPLNLPERDLLLDHAAMGCISLVVEAADGVHPFVFLPFRIRSGRIRLPMRQLIFCRAIADYRRFAGLLGRYLMWRGGAMVVHDADGPDSALLGRFFEGIGPKYYRGPDPPGHGDLAYTERVIFGP